MFDRLFGFEEEPLHRDIIKPCVPCFEDMTLHRLPENKGVMVWVVELYTGSQWQGTGEKPTQNLYTTYQYFVLENKLYTQEGFDKMIEFSRGVYE